MIQVSYYVNEKNIVHHIKVLLYFLIVKLKNIKANMILLKFPSKLYNLCIDL